MKHVRLARFLGCLSILAVLAPLFSQAGEAVRITTNNAEVFATPDSNSPVVTRIGGGRQLQTDGRTENGFLHLTTKSGRDLWIRSSDVSYAAGDTDHDLQDAEAKPPERHSSADFPHFTYDLGGGTGSVNGTNYTEINFGLNTYFVDWFLWRNALFYRFQSGLGNVYGLDTSLRGILGFGGHAAGLTFFAGPGFRFISAGQNAPFLEGGVVVKLVGLAIGVGAKTIYNSAVSPGSPNDNQIFLILSGGGSL